MAKSAFESIKAGLEDAIEYGRGNRRRGRAHRVEVPTIDVRALRESLGLSQDAFADAFMVSVATVRNWEQGRRVPEGPARVLLQVIAREPKVVLRALKKIERPKKSKKRSA